uniref:MAX dimerization protein 3 n=1 Tax=Echinostoma caproni TaxID=27848 RepID=A0A183A488_9TREM
LVCDLVAYWTRSPAELDFSDCLRKDRKEEEQRRRAELDSCTQAAKFRIQRFKHILQQLVGDVPVTDDTGDEELFSDSFVYD